MKKRLAWLLTLALLLGSLLPVAAQAESSWYEAFLDAFAYEGADRNALDEASLSALAAKLQAREALSEEEYAKYVQVSPIGLALLLSYEATPPTQEQAALITEGLLALAKATNGRAIEAVPEGELQGLYAALNALCAVTNIQVVFTPKAEGASACYLTLVNGDALAAMQAGETPATPVLLYNDVPAAKLADVEPIVAFVRAVGGEGAVAALKAVQIADDPEAALEKVLTLFPVAAPAIADATKETEVVSDEAEPTAVPTAKPAAKKAFIVDVEYVESKLYRQIPTDGEWMNSDNLVLLSVTSEKYAPADIKAEIIDVNGTSVKPWLYTYAYEPQMPGEEAARVVCIVNRALGEVGETTLKLKLTAGDDELILPYTFTVYEKLEVTGVQVEKEAYSAKTGDTLIVKQPKPLPEGANAEAMGVELSILGDGNNEYVELTDNADGTFTLKPLVAGKYEMYWRVYFGNALLIATSTLTVTGDPVADVPLSIRENLNDVVYLDEFEEDWPGIGSVWVNGSTGEAKFTLAVTGKDASGKEIPAAEAAKRLYMMSTYGTYTQFGLKNAKVGDVYTGTITVTRGKQTATVDFEVKVEKTASLTDIEVEKTEYRGKVGDVLSIPAPKLLPADNAEAQKADLDLWTMNNGEIVNVFENENGGWDVLLHRAGVTVLQVSASLGNTNITKGIRVVIEDDKGAVPASLNVADVSVEPVIFRDSFDEDEAPTVMRLNGRASCEGNVEKEMKLTLTQTNKEIAELEAIARYDEDGYFTVYVEAQDCQLSGEIEYELKLQLGDKVYARTATLSIQRRCSVRGITSMQTISGKVGDVIAVTPPTLLPANVKHEYDDIVYDYYMPNAETGYALSIAEDGTASVTLLEPGKSTLELSVSIGNARFYKVLSVEIADETGVVPNAIGVNEVDQHRDTLYLSEKDYVGIASFFVDSVFMGDDDEFSIEVTSDAPEVARFEYYDDWMEDDHRGYYDVNAKAKAVGTANCTVTLKAGDVTSTLTFAVRVEEKNPVTGVKIAKTLYTSVVGEPMRIDYPVLMNGDVPAEGCVPDDYYWEVSGNTLKEEEKDDGLYLTFEEPGVYYFYDYSVRFNGRWYYPEEIKLVVTTKANELELTFDKYWEELYLKAEGEQEEWCVGDFRVIDPAQKGGEPAYKIVNNNPAVAELRLDGNELYATPKAAGEASFTVTATLGDRTVTYTGALTVKAAPGFTVAYLYDLWGDFMLTEENDTFTGRLFVNDLTEGAVPEVTLTNLAPAVAELKLEKNDGSDDTGALYLLKGKALLEGEVNFYITVKLGDTEDTVKKSFLIKKPMPKVEGIKAVKTKYTGKVGETITIELPVNKTGASLLGYDGMYFSLYGNTSDGAWQRLERDDEELPFQLKLKRAGSYTFQMRFSDDDETWYDTEEITLEITDAEGKLHSSFYLDSWFNDTVLLPAEGKQFIGRVYVGDLKLLEGDAFKIELAADAAAVATLELVKSEDEDNRYELYATPLTKGTVNFTITATAGDVVETITDSVAFAELPFTGATAAQSAYAGKVGEEIFVQYPVIDGAAGADLDDYEYYYFYRTADYPFEVNWDEMEGDGYLFLLNQMGVYTFQLGINVEDREFLTKPITLTIANEDGKVTSNFRAELNPFDGGTIYPQDAESANEVDVAYANARYIRLLEGDTFSAELVNNTPEIAALRFTEDADNEDWRYYSIIAKPLAVGTARYTLVLRAGEKEIRLDGSFEVSPRPIDYNALLRAKVAGMRISSYASAVNNVLNDVTLTEGQYNSIAADLDAANALVSDGHVSDLDAASIGLLLNRACGVVGCTASCTQITLENGLHAMQVTITNASGVVFSDTIDNTDF